MKIGIKGSRIWNGNLPTRKAASPVTDEEMKVIMKNAVDQLYALMARKVDNHY